MLQIIYAIATDSKLNKYTTSNDFVHYILRHITVNQLEVKSRNVIQNSLLTWKKILANP